MFGGKITIDKSEMIERLKQENFNHGTAIAKVDIGENIKKGHSGQLTAYLPEMEKFAIYFPDGLWETFSETEEWILDHFEIIKE